jgi:hypothetical protein
MRRLIFFAIFFFMLSCGVTLAQQKYFERKVDIGAKPKSMTLIPSEQDTLSEYFDSLLHRRTKLENIDVYRITLQSFSPPVTKLKYFACSKEELRSLEHEDEYLLTRTYDKKAIKSFGLLIDSAFWNYQPPTVVRKKAVHDGGSVKIEGLKDGAYWELQGTNPSDYDTLFRLVELFFRKY